MKRYTGIACAYCQQKFQDTDDVVVCPICGAPHHRACYNELGHCALQDKHASGEVWQPPGSSTAAGRGEQIICPNCKAPNPKSSQYCQMCGNKLLATPPDRREQSQPQERSFTPPPGTVYTGNVDNTEQWEIQGIKAREISTYIGNNSHYYLKQFRAIQMSSTGWSWNWSAFFFGPFYLFYRKLPMLGAMILGLYILCYIPGGILFYEILKQSAPQYGGVALPYSQTLIDNMRILSTAGQIVIYTLMGAQALYANRFYMKKVLSSIQQIRAQMPHDAGSREYYARLYFAGRPNSMLAMAAVFLVICLIIIFFQSIQLKLQIPFQMILFHRLF